MFCCKMYEIAKCFYAIDNNTIETPAIKTPNQFILDKCSLNKILADIAETDGQIAAEEYTDKMIKDVEEMTFHLNKVLG